LSVTLRSARWMLAMIASCRDVEHTEEKLRF
jgi:hypothetical protein